MAARRLKRILSLCNRRGFLVRRDAAVSVTRDFDYGPSGAALKRNLVDEWSAPPITDMIIFYSLSLSHTHTHTH